MYITKRWKWSEQMANRGASPEDHKIFTGEQKKHLEQAAAELYFLLNRGYQTKQASTFVGNHYMLSERQRLALARAISPKIDILERRKKEIKDLKQVNEVHMDGFNTIITLEVALSGSPLILCLDGTLRDLAGLRGTYHIIDKTEMAIRFILDWLDENHILNAYIYLDEPVSNSGRLKTLLYECAESYQVHLEVIVMYEVDRTLEKHSNVITSDAIILNRCYSYINLGAHLILQKLPDACIIDFLEEVK